LSFTCVAANACVINLPLGGVNVGVEYFMSVTPRSGNEVVTFNQVDLDADAIRYSTVNSIHIAYQSAGPKTIRIHNAKLASGALCNGDGNITVNFNANGWTYMPR
jgi:hypothetical protein